MNEITLNCADAPNAAIANFLATLQPVSTPSAACTDNDEEDLPFEITLDRYTRDPWSVLEPSNEKIWKSCWFQSIDDKKRLPGFLKFLTNRKKAAFGLFQSPHPDEVTGDLNTAVFLVPYQQPIFPIDSQDRSKSDLIFVKYCLDESLTEAGQSKPKPKQIMQAQQQKMQRPNRQSQKQSSSTSATAKGAICGGGSGLLGNLLGATQRTNHHLDTVPARKKEKQISLIDTLSSGQVVNKFREKVEQILKDFGSSKKTEVMISISMADITREMTSMEEKAKVSLKVLEFVVNEAVEEINEEWTPYKEPGEFMDEANVVVYKAGFCPPEVMEDLNRGELPDEVKQEQRAMREAREREVQKKLRMLEEKNQKNASKHVGASMLNTAKRDRRSIEEIQNDMVDGQKKAKIE
jgi:hypothetical protein